MRVGFRHLRGEMVKVRVRAVGWVRFRKGED